MDHSLSQGIGNVIDYVKQAYRSLDHPDFSFVKKTMQSRPYYPLIKRLRDYAAVEESTDADEDVCFSYLLKGRQSLWKLDLSMVGPFGIFVRLRARVAKADFLHTRTSDLIDFERKIIELLQGGGIKLLTTGELEQPVPMTLYNTEKDSVKLYQALFSDRPSLPWV